MSFKEYEVFNHAILKVIARNLPLSASKGTKQLQTTAIYNSIKNSCYADNCFTLAATVYARSPQEAATYRLILYR